MGTVQYINWELRTLRWQLDEMKRALAEDPVTCRRPTKAEPRPLTPDEIAERLALRCLDILALPPEKVSDAQWDELIVFFGGERLSA